MENIKELENRINKIKIGDIIYVKSFNGYFEEKVTKIIYEETETNKRIIEIYAINQYGAREHISPDCFLSRFCNVKAFLTKEEME